MPVPTWQPVQSIEAIRPARTLPPAQRIEAGANVGTTCSTLSCRAPRIRILSHQALANLGGCCAGEMMCPAYKAYSSINCWSILETAFSQV